MAIAIPIIMAYSGATAALAGSLALATGITAGMAATLVTAGAGALLSATGIGGKINNAASKVFGSDLVSAANVIGAIALASGAVGGAGGASQVVDGAAAADGAMAGVDAAGAAAGADVASGVDLAGAVDAAAGTTVSTGAAEAAGSSFQGVPIEQSPYASYGGSTGSTAGYTTGDGALQIGQSGAGVKAGGLTDLVDKFKAMPDKTQAALVQAGGSALSGMAQGWSKGQDVQNAKDEQRRREALMQSGSGRQFRYTPRVGALKGV